MAKPPDTTPRSRKSTPRRRRPLKTEPAAFPTLLPLAERLEHLRIKRGLTQSVLAAQVGISTKHYQALAHAQANPTATVLLELAESLSVSVIDLFEPSAIATNASPHSREWRLRLVTDLHELAAHCRRLSVLLEQLNDEPL